MKKIISLFLVITMVFSLCACGAEKGTVLTLDNVEDYLEISGTASPGTTTRCVYKGNWIWAYNSLECNVGISGNSNYEYQDVVVGVKVTHLNPLTHEVVSERTLYIDLNLAGKGKAACYLDTSIENEDWENISSESYTCYYQSIDLSLKFTGFEVVSVTGTVVKN